MLKMRANRRDPVHKATQETAPAVDPASIRPAFPIAGALGFALTSGWLARRLRRKRG
jgi:hypothetical protein